MHRMLRRVIDGGSDRNLGSGDRQHAFVAGLAARGRIEDRLVEQNAAAVVDADDLGVAGPAIGVIAKQEEGHQAGTSSKTWGTPDACSSSQLGTGKPFSRRNSGLKSLDW